MEENKHLPGAEPGGHHEESDVSVPGVVRFAIGLVLLCGVAIVLLIGLFKYFEARDPLTPQVVRLPPQPRLEEWPTRDLAQMRAAEEHVITGYGWVDQSKGVVRIPVERAMDLLAQRGLPSRAPQPAVQSPASIPSESGLGATLAGEKHE